MQLGLANAKSTFFISLLPFMEESSLYSQWDFNNPANNVSTVKANSRAAMQISGFLCPSDSFTDNVYQLAGPAAAFPATTACSAVAGWYSGTSYAGNYGEGSYFSKNSQFAIKPNGIFFLTGQDTQLKMPGGTTLHTLVANHWNLLPVRIKDIADGTKSTLMIGEKSHSDDFFDTWTAGNSGLKMNQVSAWAWAGGMKSAAMIFCSSAVSMNNGIKFYSKGAANDINSQDRRFNGWGSGHVGGVNFVLCDGSVQFIRDVIDQITLTRLTTRAGRETISNAAAY